MFLYFEKELTWAELAKLTVKDSIQDDAAGIAAQLSYYFFLSLSRAAVYRRARELLPSLQLHRWMVRMICADAPAAVVEL